MTTDRSGTNIAIVGGGIGGLCLAMGLHNFGFRITIYEAAPSFEEIGAGIMFSPNAVRAIGLIDPRLEKSLRSVADRDGTSEAGRNVLEFRHAYHSSTGPGNFELIGSSVDETHNLIPVSRAGFLEELVKLIPEGVAQFNKRLVSIEEEENGDLIRLSFKDGTVVHHSIVLGADGIHSLTRQMILGKDNPDSYPSWSGQCGYRGRVPMDRAVEILGPDLARSNTSFLGEGSHLVCYCVGGGNFVNLTPMGMRSNWEHDQWVVPSSKGEMRAMFRGWPQKILDLLDQIDCSEIRGLFHLPNASTYYRGNVAIIGDAAHATTPFQGAGAGMAIEDAYILSNLLNQVKDISNRQEVQSALAAYDGVRRPRTTELVRTSVEAALVMDYKHPTTGFDFSRIAENVASRYKWIWEEDLPREVEQGKRVMAQFSTADPVLMDG